MTFEYQFSAAALRTAIRAGWTCVVVHGACPRARLTIATINVVMPARPATAT
jgi:hypothetical protein